MEIPPAQGLEREISPTIVYMERLAVHDIVVDAERRLYELQNFKVGP